MSIRSRATIVGAAESSRIGAVPDMSALELHSESARLALADAGLNLADVDGIASAGISPVVVAHHLGIRPTWLDFTSIGGCSSLVHVRHAAAAIASGLALRPTDRVVVVREPGP